MTDEQIFREGYRAARVMLEAAASRDLEDLAWQGSEASHTIHAELVLDADLQEEIWRFTRLAYLSSNDYPRLSQLMRHLGRRFLAMEVK